MGALKTCAPYMAMVLIQFGYAGFNILLKISLNRGVGQVVFIVYRHLIGLILLGPLAYFLERKQRPSLSLPMLIKIFLLSSLGTTIFLNLYYAGLYYTSPTVGSALGNVAPAYTFVMALLLRLEKVRLKTAKGRAKILGTVVCIGGALIFIFWKGGYQFKSLTRNPLIDTGDTRGASASVHGTGHHKEDWVKGSLLILTGYLAWSASLVQQSFVSSDYPAPLSLNAMICFFATLQCSVVALFFEREARLWRLHWNVELLTVVYTGLVNSGFVYYLQTWCINEKGPVFSAMFFPLSLVIVGILSAIIFAERLHLGSLIGALLTVVGLYIVLWGKSENSCSEGKIEEDEKHSIDHQTLGITIANQSLNMNSIAITSEKN